MSHSQNASGHFTLRFFYNTHMQAWTHPLSTSFGGLKKLPPPPLSNALSHNADVPLPIGWYAGLAVGAWGTGATLRGAAFGGFGHRVMSWNWPKTQILWKIQRNPYPVLNTTLEIRRLAGWPVLYFSELRPHQNYEQLVVLENSEVPLDN